MSAFLEDRFGAPHFLLPVLERDSSTFFTNGDDESLQRSWAREKGIPGDPDLRDILLAQIEDHRTEVFYNLDPMRFGSSFIRKLPGSVQKSIAWRAAPSPGADFGAYDLVVCNFPSILEGYRRVGWKAAYFSPAYDPKMSAYASVEERPVDVLFVGGYSRHHRRRAEVLAAVAAMRAKYRVVFHLDCSRLTRLAESMFGRMLPLRKHRRPKDICAVAAEPVFGLESYAALSQAKIVLNGAVDMAGDDRGNMRCFEALGCGALMVSDAGKYPEGMEHGKTMLLYHGAAQAISAIESGLADEAMRREMANRGHALVRTRYSKEKQWRDFGELVGGLKQ